MGRTLRAALGLVNYRIRAVCIEPMLQLRPYQQRVKDLLEYYWSAGATNVMGVMPTGAGKTVLFSKIASEQTEPCVIIAHRTELVTQIATTLGKFGVPHRIIGPQATVRTAVTLQCEEFGRHYHNPTAPCAVASVDTLVRREPDRWSNSVKLWVQDECHHLLRENKWGRAVALFPNARGLGVTATPIRADGKVLGRLSDGVFDNMVVGPSMRELIDMGSLTDYRIFAPETRIDLSSVPTGSKGDYVQGKLAAAVRNSQIVGDVVRSYKDFADGKLAVVFAVDVQTAREMARQYQHAGVPAVALDAKTPAIERAHILRDFRNRKYLVLVNVDLFGEGFDLPAIECVIMARPTQSYALFAQQFGRALRLLDGKEYAIIIDHVGNIMHHDGTVNHGLPDYRKMWELNRKKKKRNGEKVSAKFCPECTTLNLLNARECVHCGHQFGQSERSRPEEVAGDLRELSPEAIAILKAQVFDIDRPEAEYRAELERYSLPHVAVLTNLKRFRERKEAQMKLRSAMEWWSGYKQKLGATDPQSHIDFFHTFGLDVFTAQGLKTKETESLLDEVNADLERLRIEYDNQEASDLRDNIRRSAVARARRR